MKSETFSPATEDDSPAPAFRDWPLVSAIVATHKRAPLLRRALDSILAQTWKDMEVWVIHDGPADQPTIDVYEEYGPKFDEAGIDFYATATDEHTGYYTYPRNVATENCRGVYIANLDDDNEWLPDAIASLVEAMEEGEMWPDLVYGRREYVLDPGAPTKKGNLDLTKMVGPSQFTPWDSLAELRIAGNKPTYNFIDSSDFLVTKAALYRLGIAAGRVWDETKRRFGDFYLVSDGLLAAQWRFKALDKVVQRYHITGSNVSLNRDVNEAPRTVNV